MATKKYFSGVLPYAIDNGIPYLLLGRESRGSDKGKWSGFAGRYDRIGESAIQLACREAFEESLGVLGTPDSICAALLRTGTRIEVSRGTHFLMPIAFDVSLPSVFQRLRARASSPSPSTEKDMLAWVPLPHGIASLPLRAHSTADMRRITDLLTGAKW